ncbi:MAG: alpha/beta hydrolase [Candidatus Bathyarchaeota archaeon]|nr:alpha/beta hydrolase [Candidatus Bathyarchaeota archaeon]
MPDASVNGININYTIDGQGDPLILIIGLGSDQSNWRPQIAFFKKHNRIITLDNRGVGKSDKPHGPYSTKMMAEDIIGLMNHLGIKKAHILGVSMGGMIAQEVAINHPNMVNKLVLGCTYARMDETGGFTQKISEAIDAYYKSSRDLSSLRRLVNAILDSTFNKMSYRVLALPLMKTAINSTTSWQDGFVEQLDATLAHDTVDRLHMIVSPTLVLTGTDDKVIKPSSSDVIANHVIGARLVKVNGGSHGFCGEMSDKFNKIVLDFLRS